MKDGTVQNSTCHEKAMQSAFRNDSDFYPNLVLNWTPNPKKPNVDDIKNIAFSSEGVQSSMNLDWVYFVILEVKSGLISPEN